VVQGLATLPSSATIQTRALVVYTDSRSRLFGLGGIHALLDVRCKAIECLFNVDVVFRGHLQEWNAELVSQLLALFGRDGPLLLPVALVSDEDFVYSFAGMLLHI